MALIQCQDCHQTISDKAVVCPHCGNIIVRPYKVRYRDYVKSPISEALRPKSYMVHSVMLVIASFLLFTIWCLPFAIASFIYANKVDNLWETGDVDGAIYASRSAYRWFSIGLWIGVISWLVVIILILFFVGLIING